MIPEPRPPRLPDAPEPLTNPVLEDDAAWEDALVTGVVAIGVEAERVDIMRTIVRCARLSGATLDRLRLTDVLFEDCDLAGVVLTEAVLLRVELRRCRLSTATLTDVKGNDVRFADCSLADANLRMSTWERTRFEQCDLTRADLYAARMSDAAMAGGRLDGLVVSKAKFARVALHGSTIDQPIVGGEALRGAVIGSDQAVPLLPSLLAAVGVTIDDDYLTEPEPPAKG